MRAARFALLPLVHPPLHALMRANGVRNERLIPRARRWNFWLKKKTNKSYPTREGNDKVLCFLTTFAFECVLTVVVVCVYVLCTWCFSIGKELKQSLLYPWALLSLTKQCSSILLTFSFLSLSLFNCFCRSSSFVLV